MGMNKVFPNLTISDPSMTKGVMVLMFWKVLLRLV